VVERTNAKLVIIDPLMAAMQDAEFDRPREARLKLEALKGMAAETGVVVIVIHHLNKAYGRANQNRLSGSHQLSAASSASWTMQITKKSKAATEFDLNYWARIIGSGTLKIRSSGLTSFHDVTKYEDEDPQLKLTRRLTTRDALLRLVEGEPNRIWTTKEAAAAIDRRTSTVNGRVEELVNEGKLERPIPDGPNANFRLVLGKVDDPSEEATEKPANQAAS
jgi:AAA domain